MSHLVRRPSLQVRDLMARLVSLGCPYMGGVEESWVNDLVFEAGESRDRIVKWLVEEVLGAGIDKVDVPHHTGSSKPGHIAKLTHVCSCLGLCDATDFELVSGVQKNPAQVTFINRLLSIVETLKNTKCFELVAQGKELVTEMTQEELREVTSKGEVDLIPADIKKYIELDHLVEEGADTKQGVKIMSLLSELAREAENIETEIENQTKEIESLGVSSEERKEFTDLMQHNRTEYTTKIKSTSASLQNLKFLLANFTDFYNLEVEPELKKRHFPPLQTELGLEIAQANSALRENLELIERAKELSVSAKQIKSLNDSKEQFGQLGKLATSIVNTLY